MSSHASSYAPTPNASAEALDPRATLLKATQALGMHESTAEQRFATDSPRVNLDLTWDFKFQGL